MKQFKIPVVNLSRISVPLRLRLPSISQYFGRRNIKKSIKPALKLENGFGFLLENGGRLLIESGGTKAIQPQSAVQQSGGTETQSNGDDDSSN